MKQYYHIDGQFYKEKLYSNTFECTTSKFVLNSTVLYS